MRLTRRNFCMFAAGLALGAPFSPGHALEVRAEPLAVVELFTSQGCARCPAADQLLASMANRSEIVALAYHIDYWDYAGWEDTFALPANAELQKAYALSWGKSRIYTPQMVVNGRQGVVGSQSDEVDAALRTANLPVGIALALEENGVVQLSASGLPGAQAAVVWLVTFRNAAEVMIERGENSGHTLRYTQIVTGRQAIGMWDPQSGSAISIPLAEVLGSHNDGAAILIQQKKGNLPGPILGAVALRR